MAKKPEDFAIPRYNPVHSEEKKMEKHYKYSLFFKLLSGSNFFMFDFRGDSISAKGLRRRFIM